MPIAFLTLVKFLNLKPQIFIPRHRCLSVVSRNELEFCMRPKQRLVWNEQCPPKTCWLG